MDFSLTDEQRQLQDSVARYVRERYSFDQYRQIIRSQVGWSAENWREMADMGWLAVPIPEEYGGLGCTPVETMVVMEQFGRGLVPEPYVTTVVMAGNLLANAGSAEQREELLPQIAAGDLRFAFALAEADGRYDLDSVATRAERDGSDYRMTGTKFAVLQAPAADKLVVTARTAGGRDEAEGVTLFLVDADQDGVVRTGYRTLDGRPASNIEFKNVRVPGSAVIGTADAGLGALNATIDHAVAALAAEATGAMDVLIDTTTDYVKTRKQFGTTIGSFQVIQHRLVDMVIQREHSRSMVYMLTAKLAQGDADTAAAAAATKAAVGQRGRFIGGQAVHLHGAMGMTDELPIGDYFKRLMMIDISFGDAHYQRARYSRLVDAASGATRPSQVA